MKIYNGVYRVFIIISLLVIMSLCFSCSSKSLVTPYTPPVVNQTVTPTASPSINTGVPEPTKPIIIITTTPPDVTSTPNVPEIKLDPSILKAAVADSEFRDSWGVNLAVININYKSGVRVSGWIVLHNGNDIERYVTLKYLAADKVKVSKVNNKTYLPTPNEMNEQFVTIGESVVRLEKMETRAIDVSLLIPSNVDLSVKNWYFNVNAEGTGIRTSSKEHDVTSIENDHMLELKLDHPLFLDDISSVKITSNIDELPIVTKYDKDNMILTIENLKESSNRKLLVEYEFTDMVLLGYNQQWFITML